MDDGSGWFPSSKSEANLRFSMEYMVLRIKTKIFVLDVFTILCSWSTCIKWYSPHTKEGGYKNVLVDCTHFY